MQPNPIYSSLNYCTIIPRIIQLSMPFWNRIFEWFTSGSHWILLILIQKVRGENADACMFILYGYVEMVLENNKKMEVGRNLLSKRKILFYFSSSLHLSVFVCFIFFPIQQWVVKPSPQPCTHLPRSWIIVPALHISLPLNGDDLSQIKSHKNMQRNCILIAEPRCKYMVPFSM